MNGPDTLGSVLLLISVILLGAVAGPGTAVAQNATNTTTTPANGTANATGEEVVVTAVNNIGTAIVNGTNATENGTANATETVTEAVENATGEQTDQADDQDPPETVEADDGQDDATDDSGNESEGCNEHIDDETALCGYHYDAGAGEVVLTLYSDRPQRVTLTDAGAFMTGGEVNRQRATLNGRSEVRLAVTEYNGFVGVSVDTGRTLYAVPIETSSSLSAPKESDLLALLAGIVIVPAAAVGVYRVREELRDDGVMRIDG